MTKTERKEQTEWRKCAVCGKYMSYIDMDSGKVVSSCDISLDGLDYGEPYLLHAKCAEVAA